MNRKTIEKFAINFKKCFADRKAQAYAVSKLNALKNEHEIFTEGQKELNKNMANQL